MLSARARPDSAGARRGAPPRSPRPRRARGARAGRDDLLDAKSALLAWRDKAQLSCARQRSPLRAATSSPTPRTARRPAGRRRAATTRRSRRPSSSSVGTVEMHLSARLPQARGADPRLPNSPATFSRPQMTQRNSMPPAWDGVGWAVVSVTTAGYGDSFPETDAVIPTVRPAGRDQPRRASPRPRPPSTSWRAQRAKGRGRSTVRSDTPAAPAALERPTLHTTINCPTTIGLTGALACTFIWARWD